MNLLAFSFNQNCEELGPINIQTFLKKAFLLSTPSLSVH